MHKVLIVEDDEGVREVLREALEDEGYWVGCAADGEEALRMLRAEPAPCLVLLDLVLPGLNGWQLREKQLADPFLAQFPVVVLTATSTLEAAAISADAWLKKPAPLEEVLATVARFCTPADFSRETPTEVFAPSAALVLDDSAPVK